MTLLLLFGNNDQAGAFTPQVYTATVEINPTPTRAVEANLTPTETVDANPTPDEEVETG